MILAINAFHVTSFKENIAYSVGSADGGFLPPMDTNGGYMKTRIYTTNSRTSHEPVNITAMGA